MVKVVRPLVFHAEYQPILGEESARCCSEHTCLRIKKAYESVSKASTKRDINESSTQVPDLRGGFYRHTHPLTAASVSSE